MTLATKKPEEKVIHRPSARTERWDDLEKTFGRVFENFWQRPHIGLTPELWPHRATVPMPAVDVYEEKNAVVVKAEMPGLNRDEVEVQLTDSMLTLRGEKKQEEEVRERNYYRSERTHGMVSRTIELPADVNTTKAEATFTNGVLEVRLPKTDGAASKSRKVRIK